MINRRLFLGAGAALGFGGGAFAHDIILPGKAKRHQEKLQALLDAGGDVVLGPGRFVVERLRISRTVRLSGVPGLTKITSDTAEVLAIEGAADVTIDGISLSSSSREAVLISGKSCENLAIRNCRFRDGGRGIALERCSGVIEGNICNGLETSGIFSLDAKGLSIRGNTVFDIGNNGIHAWQSEEREDGTLITGNRVYRIAAKSGGTGEYGNGISMFRAGNVIVANNRISDCAFSCIRNNSGDGVQIIGNSLSRSGEVAIYVEFAFQGAVVANNMLTDVAFGISVTNFDVDGRLASVTGNVIRGVRGGKSAGVKIGGAIHAEADTVVANNVIEDVKDFGINLGWSGKTRNLMATGNLIRNSARPIAASVTEGAGEIVITNNRIEVPQGPAILALDYEKVVSDDLSLDGAKLPPSLKISGNVVTR